MSTVFVWGVQQGLSDKGSHSFCIVWLFQQLCSSSRKRWSQKIYFGTARTIKFESRKRDRNCSCLKKGGTEKENKLNLNQNWWIHFKNLAWTLKRYYEWFGVVENVLWAFAKAFDWVLVDALFCTIRLKTRFSECLETIKCWLTIVILNFQSSEIISTMNEQM